MPIFFCWRDSNSLKTPEDDSESPSLASATEDQKITAHSIEHPEHMFKLMDKKIIAVLRIYFWLNWSYVLFTNLSWSNRASSKVFPDWVNSVLDTLIPIWDPWENICASCEMRKQSRDKMPLYFKTITAVKLHISTLCQICFKNKQPR